MTDYDGNNIIRSKVQFPKGNTPIRTKNIEKISRGVYNESDSFLNIAFPADKRRVVENKLNKEEINLSPDRGPYLEIEDDPYEDETLSTLLPNTEVALNQGTFDYSTDLERDEALQVAQIGNRNFRLFIKDSWWDYEPPGLEGVNNINPADPEALPFTSQEELVSDNTKTFSRHVYQRYDGTTLNGKTDSMYRNKNFNPGIGFDDVTGDRLPNGVTMVISEDLVDPTDLVNYDPLHYDKIGDTDPADRVAIVNSFLKIDDDRKIKYESIPYYNLAMTVSFPDQIDNTSLPKKNEVFLEKERDLVAGFDGSLEYTTEVPGRIGEYTFTGTDAFDLKWKKK